ncbi:hypothetical protein ABT063_16370 [Streptomyces sp. NPDC002838]|uniref:hypothetical protein n=1 Tax=Streptomyces sp. NPDC002838 TaxID=3154436 RepID=UPI00332CF2E5
MLQRHKLTHSGHEQRRHGQAAGIHGHPQRAEQDGRQPDCCGELKATQGAGPPGRVCGSVATATARASTAATKPRETLFRLQAARPPRT